MLAQPFARLVDKLWIIDGFEKMPQRNNLKLAQIGVFCGGGSMP